MNLDISKLNHHEQLELCSTRPSYRQGRKLTAVKVYTVSDESTHLLISRVPAIQLHAELSALCSRFGTITCCVLVPGYDSGEMFIETYHVQYARLQSARFAKRQLDGRSFYGGVLHVCYAPELETVQETRSKLVLRRKEVASRVRKRNIMTNGSKKFGKIGDLSTATTPQNTETSTWSVAAAQQPQQGTHSFCQSYYSMETRCNPSLQPSLNSPLQALLSHPPPQAMFGNPSSQISPNILPSQTLLKLPHTALPSQPPPQTISHSQPQALFCNPTSTKLLLSQSSPDPQPQTSLTHPPQALIRVPPSKTSLRFIPRQVSVPKRIVFHKKL